MIPFFKTLASPVGALTLLASDRGLSAILWENDTRSGHSALADGARHPVLVEAARQLDEYFGGQRRTFSVALDAAGTEFQKAVWRALAEIPFGETRSYAQIARRIGRPKAVRAVGAANGKNPIPIIVPCHRVIGADGTLTGFGGGIETKARLLRLEGWTFPMS